MPIASAPSMSSAIESPTITAVSGSTPISSSAARKMVGLGFTFPCAPEEIQASTSRPKWRMNASRSRLVFDTSAIFTPCSRSARSTGRASSYSSKFSHRSQPRVISSATSCTAAPVPPMPRTTSAVKRIQISSSWSSSGWCARSSTAAARASS